MSGTGHQSKPPVSGECRCSVAYFVLPIDMPMRIPRWGTLLPQPLAYLGTEGGPIIGAHVRFKTRSEQGAHGGKHGFAAIHGHGGFGGSLRARGDGGRLHLARRLRL